MKERLDHTEECMEQHVTGQLDCVCGAYQSQRVVRPVDPDCTDCGHPRSEHEEEPPYPCYCEGFCECRGFSYAPKGMRK